MYGNCALNSHRHSGRGGDKTIKGAIRGSENGDREKRQEGEGLRY